MYKAVDPRVSFPKMEEKILEFWNQNKIFEKSISQREQGDATDEFVFYDGPPFATGLPHFGHFVPGTIKDIIPRYQTMKGKKVTRRFGWDCHGLPVEYEMEKELGISGKSQIEEYGVANFNEACRGIVLRYTAEWEKTIRRLGRWVDFENDYKTMDPEYMETIWWVFKSLYDQGLIYEGHYILPYSPALATPLSNFEVNLGGYKDVTDPAITVRFTATSDTVGGDPNSALPGTGPISFLAWTTTPWTLPSNLGLCVGPEIDYVLVQDGDERFILAESRLAHYYKPEKKGEEAKLPPVLARFKGSELVGYTYEPVFEYFTSQRENGAFQVWSDDYVTTEDGTGVVHLSPGFGEDDYRIMQQTQVDTLVPIDAEARFTAEVSDFEGLYVKDADKEIIRHLKDKGKLILRENYLHSYPHCYRTGKPLIYRAISSWFVDIDKVKAKMLAANAQIEWMPGHLQEGRFGKWLENARDWAISRNRFWGNPIPIWKCDGSEHVECIGSIEELEQKSGVKVTDLHKHYVDEITWPSPDGKGTMERVPEVLDCWFESGAMPYAQNHYPFENKEHFEANYPADFIAEGLDQTRGWFYTLTVLAASLFDKPAFKNVIVNGLVLASDGRKMSKSLRNFSDPNEVIDSFGADALRLFLMDSAVVKAEDLKYSDDGVKEVLKSVIIPFWNAYSFFVTYANLDGFESSGLPVELDNPLDRWIVSKVESLVADVTDALDRYDLQKSVTPLVEFIDLLNNWYIRRSRPRFWKGENDADKSQGYETLLYVLKTFVKVAAPFMPFITEEIYRNLASEGEPESVHLCDYPVVNEAQRDLELEEKMDLARTAVTMGRAIRSMHNLKVRQPLSALHIVTRDRGARNVLMEFESHIRDEINVKEIIYRDNEEDVVTYSAKANFKVLGKQLGPKMKAAAARIAQLEPGEVQTLVEGAVLSIDVDGETLDLNEEMVLVQRDEKEGLKVLNEGNLTVALDPVVTEELKQEGLIRDLIRAIQNLRKERDFQVSDRIKLQVHGDEELVEAVKNWEDTIAKECLAVDVGITNTPLEKEVEVGESKGSIDVEVSGS